MKTLLPALLLLSAAIRLHGENSATLRFSVTGPDGAPLPCRVHLYNAAGEPIRPQSPKLPFWRDHFVCDGSAELTVPDGELRYEIEHGPEWKAAAKKVVVKAGEILRIDEKLTRIANLGAEGWWGGETHVHRPLADVPLLMRAEDLNIASVATWWNDADAWEKTTPPADAVTSFDGNRFFHQIAGEDERAGGALLFHNMKAPLPLARFPGKSREWPSSAKFLDDARKAGAFIEVEKPFWRDFPVWLARGVDAVGIVHNHMHRGGIYDGEAWGRPRELAEFPGTQGNGFYTQRLYYRALNSGLRIPPIAGSASGVLPNPVGYNRAYVQCEGPLTWDNWWAGLKAGRVFVTNGPLLRLTANAQLPGATLKTDGGPLQVNIAGRLDSRDPIKSVELVHNNRIERITLPAQVTINESGWFLVRALADVPHTFRFASTAPWYVELGKRETKDAPFDRASPQFFLSWTREQIGALKINDATKRAEALAPWKEAEKFWEAKVSAAPPIFKITGRIADAASGALLPARLYIRRDDGRWYFPRHEFSLAPPPNPAAIVPGRKPTPKPDDDAEEEQPPRPESDAPRPRIVATRYDKRNWLNPASIEMHTALGAAEWSIDLEPGRYTFTAERGKEWLPATREVVVGNEPLKVDLALKRFANLAEEGWFSGDTHVHRTLDDLPATMLADDLNVAFPLTHWVTKGGLPPTKGDKNMNAKQDAEVRAEYVDATHAYWPLNTEWEIFSIGGKQHTLGAIFALGHAKPFEVGAPPLGPLAYAARDQKAMLDIDKPDWPWAIGLPPITNAKLYELANNHMWRTEFAFTKWNSPAPAWMLPNARNEGTERDWIEYTHRAYWTLLNCGQRMVATAGTASGVHPVPLGFGRVFAHCGPVFRYELWTSALQAGRSFATTGPLLVASCDGEYPGKTWPLTAGEKRNIKLSGRIQSERSVGSIEVIVNGETAATLKPSSVQTPEGAFETKFEHPLSIAGTTWVALRCWESRDGGRVRFAHTSPWWFEDASQPLRPRRQEAEWLAARVRTELERSRALLTEDAIGEYEYAIKNYEDLLKNARP